MSCDGLQALNPICQATKVVTQTALDTADSAFTHVAGFFGMAALGATSWLWDELSAATTLDLHSPGLGKEIGATATIAGVLCLALFVIQVITATLRREPAGLGRAVHGLLTAFVGTAVALGTVQLLVTAVDALSDGLVSYTMGTNVRGVGTKLAFGKLVTFTNPAVTLLFSVVILCATVLVWAAMMIRKVMILVAAVLAPLAFSGATADITRGWVRRWIEFVAAMIAAKLLLVIILTVGVTVLNGAGQVGTAPTQTTTQLAGGTLLLLLGGLAPWLSLRMFHFAGDTLQAAHATAAHGSAGGHAVVAAPQKLASLQWQAHSLSYGVRSLGSRHHGTGAAPMNPPPGTMPPQPGRHRAVGGAPPAGPQGPSAARLGSAPPAAGAAGAGTASTGPATAGSTAVGAGAAGPVALPTAAAAATGQATKSVVNRAHGAATAAAPPPAAELPPSDARPTAPRRPE